MLATFVASKLIIQTDLIMIAPLGEITLAAYAAPTRVMLLDAIVAFGLGPVVSVLISGERDPRKRREHIRMAIGLAGYLGCTLMLIGLLVYPPLLDMTVSNQEVAALARPALLILTLAIPLRLTQFIATMVLYGIGRGQAIIPYLIASIILNVGLNALFIHGLDMGFTGCYTATFLTALFEWVVTLYLLRRECTLRDLITPPRVKAVRELLAPAVPETLRLIFIFGVQFAALALYAGQDGKVAQLSVYSVGAELYLLLLMPMIAAMRSTAVVLAQDTDLLQRGGLWNTLRPVFYRGIPLVLLVSTLLLALGDTLGREVFHLTPPARDWWQAFVLFAALSLPLTLFNALQRGAWQSRQRFTTLFYIDASVQWGIIVPCITLGLYLDTPWIAWGYLLLTELATGAILLTLRSRLNEEHLGGQLYLQNPRLDRDPS